MAKGQQKQGRESKKPKQNKTTGSGSKTSYAQSMSSKSEAAPFDKKK